MKLGSFIQIGALFATSSLMAISIDPTYTTFGTLNVSFGGTGIPNDAVAISSVQIGSSTITLGLTAHQRYSNPAVQNDGAGTFWAISGGDIFSGSNSNANYARWNLGYYANIDPNISGASVRLYYDKNPGLDTDVTTYRTLAEPTNTSDNLAYGGSFFGFSWGFPSGTFNPSAVGEYSFALVVLQNGTELARTAINVNVNETGHAPVLPVPDGGLNIALLGFALAGLVGLRRRFVR